MQNTLVKQKTHRELVRQYKRSAKNQYNLAGFHRDWEETTGSVPPQPGLQFANFGYLEPDFIMSDPLSGEVTVIQFKPMEPFAVRFLAISEYEDVLKQDLQFGRVFQGSQNSSSVTDLDEIKSIILELLDIGSAIEADEVEYERFPSIPNSKLRAKAKFRFKGHGEPSSVDHIEFGPFEED